MKSIIILAALFAGAAAHAFPVRVITICPDCPPDKPFQYHYSGGCSDDLAFCIGCDDKRAWESAPRRACGMCPNRMTNTPLAFEGECIVGCPAEKEKRKEKKKEKEESVSCFLTECPPDFPMRSEYGDCYSKRDKKCFVGTKEECDAYPHQGMIGDRCILAKCGPGQFFADKDNAFLIHSNGVVNSKGFLMGGDLADACNSWECIDCADDYTYGTSKKECGKCPNRTVLPDSESDPDESEPDIYLCEKIK